MTFGCGSRECIRFVSAYGYDLFFLSRSLHKGQFQEPIVDFNVAAGLRDSLIDGKAVHQVDIHVVAQVSTLHDVIPQKVRMSVLLTEVPLSDSRVCDARLDRPLVRRVWKEEHVPDSLHRRAGTVGSNRNAVPSPKSAAWNRDERERLYRLRCP